MSTVFVFPGQGAQFVGMGKDIIEADGDAKAIFDRAKEITGIDMAQICLEGPEESLTDTLHAQLAVFLVSVAYCQALQKKGVQPDFMAGHSLGELSAYYIAGVLSLDDAIRLVQRRGELMQAATQVHKGSMTAVLGLAVEDIQAILENEANGQVIVANDNCPGQVIISGEPERLVALEESLKAAGAKRLIPLKVAGAFHSPQMNAASEAYASEVEQYRFSDAKVPIVLNRTAAIESSAEALKANLPAQIISSVRWRETAEWLGAKSPRFIECGPGAVISGLVKKTCKGASIHTINSVEALDALDSVEVEG